MRSSISNFKLKRRKAWLVRGAYVLLTLLVFFTADRIAGIVLNKINEQSKQRFVRLYKGGNPPAVVVLGSSRGVNSIYSPDLQKRLDVPVINISYNGMSTLLAEAIFRDYLANNEKPLFLALEITNIMSSHKLMNELKLYIGESDYLGEIAKEEAATTYWASQLFHLYRYNGELLLRNMYYLKNSDQTWINRYSIDSSFIEDYEPSLDSRDWTDLTFAENLEAMKRIIDLCEQEDIPLEIYVSPYLPKHMEYVTDYDEWLADIREAAGPEYRIWDYALAVKDDEYFADPLHMNYDGTVVLLDQMLEDGFFDDVRSPAASQSVESK